MSVSPRQEPKVIQMYATVCLYLRFSGVEAILFRLVFGSYSDEKWMHLQVAATIEYNREKKYQVGN